MLVTVTMMVIKKGSSPRHMSSILFVQYQKMQELHRYF